MGEHGMDGQDGHGHGNERHDSGEHRKLRRSPDTKDALTGATSGDVDSSDGDVGSSGGDVGSSDGGADQSVRHPLLRPLIAKPSRFDPSMFHVHEAHQLLYGADFLSRRPRSTDPLAVVGSAHFMRLNEYADLRAWWHDQSEEDSRVGPGGYFHIPATPLVEWSEDGGQLVALPFEGIPLPGRLAARHLLAIGATGSGKTYRLAYGLLASLLRDTSASIFYNSVKGRVTTRELTAIAREMDPSIRVVVFAPSDAERSVAVNPVAIARRHGLVEQLAHQLACIVREGTGGTNFWSASAARKFAAILRYPEIDSIARLADLVTDPKKLLEFARKKGDAELESIAHFSTSGANGATSEQNDSACLESFISSDAVRAITSGPDECDVVKIAQSKDRWLFILEADDSTHARLAPVIALVLQLAFDGLARAGRDDRTRAIRPVCFLLDELGAAPIAGLARKISVGRTHGYTVCGMVQTLAQLEARYGQDADELIAGFNTRLWFLGGLSRVDQAVVMRNLGSVLVDEISRRESRGEDGAWVTEAREVRQAERPLFDVHEFRMKPHRDDIYGGVVLAELVEHPPMLCHITPSWRDPRVADAMQRGAAAPDELRTKPLSKARQRWDLIDPGSAVEELRQALGSLHELDEFDLPPEERKLLIGARKVAPEMLEQMIAMIRPVIAWPAPPRLVSCELPWIHRYEASHTRVAVYSLMSSLKLRKKTAVDLMRALEKAGSDDSVVGLAQLDLDTLRECGEGGTGTSVATSGASAPRKLSFWRSASGSEAS